MIQDIERTGGIALVTSYGPDRSRVMNKVFSITVLLALAASALAQGSQTKANQSKSNHPTKQISNPAKKPGATANKKPKPAAAPTPVDPDADQKVFDAAVAAPTMRRKAELLREFLDRFPDSSLREDAFTYLITTRAAAGDEMIRAGDLASGLASLKLAVEEAPAPVPERVFNDVILKIPGDLFYSNQRTAAMELALLIEKKVAASPKQLLGVAAFYLGIENAAEARRVAEAAIAVDPNLAAGYQALGLAHRLNFDLEDSAKAYAKAVEVDPGSVSAKRSLAEMNRALGKPEAAAAIYREILAAAESDAIARQGLILALFDGGEQKEAEAELSKVLASEPRNFALLTSVAYWYAANEQADRAVEYAQKALAIEPRYIWGHIALGRGLMKQNKPIDAERALLRARQYGNFPTLDYELASARFQAGFYREAVEDLRKTFSVKDGLVATKLGGRVLREEKSFQDLIAHERKASLLQPLPADRAETAEKLKLLLELSGKVEQSPDETELSLLADEFVKGSDKMKLHRQLFVANLLLQKNVAVAKVAELVKASVGNVDAGLEVSAPGAAVMASELYESRSIAFARNEVVVIPEVPRQTLSAILRGRIEELAGWTLYQQKNYPEAIVRLKRSISVLPDKSAWWRSSMWRLGSALEAEGKDKEALDSYIKSYVTDRPTPWKYGTIEALYRKVNGGTDGLEDKIGANPLTASTSPPIAQPTPGIEPRRVETADNTPTSAEPPARLNGSEPRFPRHVPVQASVVTADKPVVADKPDVSVEKPAPAGNGENSATAVPVDPAKAVEEKKSEPKTDATSVLVSSAEQKTSADAAPLLKADSTAANVDPKTSERKAETIGQPVTAPPTQVRQEPVTETETGIVQAALKEIPAETQAARTDPPPTLVARTPEPANHEAAVQPKPSEAKDPAPVGNATTASPTDRTGDNRATSEDTPAPKQALEKSDMVKADAGTAKDSALAKTDPPKNEKDLTQISDRVEVSPPKTDPLADRAHSEPALRSESSIDADPPKSELAEKDVVKAQPTAANDAPKAEPVNLLRDPFANTDPPPSKPERAGTKPVIIVNDPFKTGEKSTKTKDLFEPVIIKVPGGASASKPKERTAGSERESVEVRTEPSASAGRTRSRVIEGKEISSDQRCSIAVSQDNIMLLSGGGSLGLRVSIDGDGDLKDIMASSGNPRDIEVRPEPLIDGVTGRRFYVIKSISDRTGIFQVNLESPCGKREITVHVR